jgi:DNA helicase HerA-like ATPase
MGTSDQGLLIGGGEAQVFLLPARANRHGLIAGATGTGKTVTLQGLTEAFSAIGVPVFLADVKGDLGGLSQPGDGKPVFAQRAQQLGLADYTLTGYPTIFWDVGGSGRGHPLRTTVSDFGPLLFARLLDLNEVQTGVLNLVFKLADDQGLLLLDLKDLRAMLVHVAENAKQLTTEYGNVSAATVGTIQRALLALEQDGGDAFFGEPALEIADLMLCDSQGRGAVNILLADKLLQSPKHYATSLLWLLSELFEELPEAGDLPKPKLVFIFDEAHLLFEDAPDALIDKIEQVVRLIRSKGIGVYFVTQNPLDVPEKVLGQLGNRVQHALRAFTPRDQKAVRAAAETFRPNPKIRTEQAITELGVGEALVSVLDAKGAPTPVERVLIRPPQSRVGPITEDERKPLLEMSPVGPKYDQTVDRESAYERLKGRTMGAPVGDAPMPKRAQGGNPWGPRPARTAPPPVLEQSGGYEMPQSSDEPPPPRGRRAPARRSDTLAESAIKSAARAAASQLGRQVVRGLLGSILRGRR